MRGFLVGSFALIVLYAVLQPGAAGAAAAGGNVTVSGLRRLLSADVAGIPQRKGAQIVTEGGGLLAPGAPGGGSGGAPSKSLTGNPVPGPPIGPIIQL